MSYSQEIYDAVRSKINGGNVSDAVESVARDAFGAVSHQAQMVAQDWSIAAHEQQRPCVLFKPKIMQDGNAWIALLGDDLVTGVVGCGNTPAEAMVDFDRVFYGNKSTTEERAL